MALAGSLTGLERQELRQRLAHHFLPLHPALSLYYARKAGLDELAAAALQEAQQGSPQCRSASGLGQVAEPLAAPPRPARAVGTPAALPPFRREVRTSNGYRVALDSGTLEVLRYGWYGPPPLLVLNAAAGTAGPWQMTARIDVFRDTPELGCCPRGYALGIKCGPGLELNYVPEGQVPEDRVPEGQDKLQDAPECSSGAPSSSSSSSTFGEVPLGRWFTLQGEAQAGPLQLSVRALDVALTVADFSCGGRELLPVRS